MSEGKGVGLDPTALMGVGRNQPCPCGSGRKFKMCCLDQVPVLRPQQAKQKMRGCAIIALMPTRGRITIETHSAMSQFDGHKVIEIPRARVSIEQARNELWAIAGKLPHNLNWEPELGFYVCWIDDDAFWVRGAVSRLLRALQAPQIDVIAGWFGPRAPFGEPKCFRADGMYPRPGEDCNAGDVVEVEKFGFHFVMHKWELIEEIGRMPFTPDEGDEISEDLAFCKRARSLDKRLWVDTGAFVAHVDDDGGAYIPFEDRMEVIGTQLFRNQIVRKYDGPDPATVTEDVKFDPTEQIANRQIAEEGVHS